MIIRGLWGLQIKSNEELKFKVPASLKITMASIYQFNGLGRTSLYIRLQGTDLMLCSLIPEKIEQQVIDITCLRGETILFRSEGPNGIHLLGNYISQNGIDDSEEESETIQTISKVESSENDHESQMEDIYTSEFEQERWASSDEDDFDDVINPFLYLPETSLTTNVPKDVFKLITKQDEKTKDLSLMTSIQPVIDKIKQIDHKRQSIIEYNNMKDKEQESDAESPSNKTEEDTIRRPVTRRYSRDKYNRKYAQIIEESQQQTDRDKQKETNSDAKGNKSKDSKTTKITKHDKSKQLKDIEAALNSRILENSIKEQQSEHQEMTSNKKITNDLESKKKDTTKKKKTNRSSNKERQRSVSAEVERTKIEDNKRKDNNLKRKAKNIPVNSSHKKLTQLSEQQQAMEGVSEKKEQLNSTETDDLEKKKLPATNTILLDNNEETSSTSSVKQKETQSTVVLIERFNVPSQEPKDKKKEDQHHNSIKPSDSKRKKKIKKQINKVQEPNSAATSQKPIKTTLTPSSTLGQEEEVNLLIERGKIGGNHSKKKKKNKIRNIHKPSENTIHSEIPLVDLLGYKRKERENENSTSKGKKVMKISNEEKKRLERRVETDHLKNTSSLPNKPEDSSTQLNKKKGKQEDKASLLQLNTTNDKKDGILKASKRYPTRRTVAEGKEKLSMLC
ncbi:uncharacterized protein BX663DRAFT_490724 [Cokeromyces recurvatus]|uniref:uncharacterized protein n=1 Tax=Cokeromyces recurvatus TaxID=90255 RepID=UPI00221F8EC2|nr:uncharacterized protein BX663DRAFT_490724 [Cokeromyces recurvatus]KAI7897595.1 hypothetical protein BX663DRAFT_490724 [Cokeromyces recurvatus]